MRTQITNSMKFPQRKSYQDFQISHIILAYASIFVRVFENIKRFSPSRNHIK